MYSSKSVTNSVNKMIVVKANTILVINFCFGDPQKSKKKKLVINFLINKNLCIKTCEENYLIFIYHNIYLSNTLYYICYITQILKKKIKYGKTVLYVTNTTFNDKYKTLTLNFENSLIKLCKKN